MLLATVLVDAEVSEYDSRSITTRASTRKFCVAVCPVGAIRKDAEFDALA